MDPHHWPSADASGPENQRIAIVTELSADRAAEQQHLDVIYARLDELLASAERQLTEVRATGSVGTPQARSERDAFATRLELRLHQLRAVQDRLCFGRLDVRDGQRHHIGRIGLADQGQDKLLVDWRAPVAAPFYQATAAAPGEVVRRRHLTTHNRELTHLDDEVFDLAAMGAKDRATLAGEGALMAALTAPRTGRMGDIVATIQAEQDRIVRADLAGVVVVQGGPGTGKTAVALHRAAYLLFTHRARLARSGVLIVGPGQLFLRYIEQVLPSLGESGVVMATPGTLIPGLSAQPDVSDAVTALKGDIRLAQVLNRAVADRQRLPDSDLKLAVGSHRLILSRAAVATARARARATGAPHNLARVTFVKDVLRHLARQLAEQMGQELSVDLREELDADLRDSRDVRVNLNLLWMPLTPLKFLQDLFATEVRLASAARSLKPAERALLARDRSEPIRVADVPLLAELGDLIGDDGEAAKAAQADQIRERAQERDYAESVLSMTGLSGSGVNADMLVDQFSAFGSALTVAERAAEDPEWTFGHLVVDEAQELSPMMWRLLARKCPNRSWTVVGDLAQRAAVDGAVTWAQVLDPVAAGRWQEQQLTVSYRTPGRVLALADAVAAAGDLPVSPVRSVREGDFDPQILAWPGQNPPQLAQVVRDLVAQAEQGTVAVVAPEVVHAQVAEGLARELPGLVGMAADSALSVRVSVLRPDQVKGLEFDDVVVLEPGEIVAAGRRGLSDLYVALSRPTRRLVVLHSGPLPPGLS